MQLEYDPETDTITTTSYDQSNDSAPPQDRAWDNAADVERMMREAATTREWSELKSSNAPNSSEGYSSSAPNFSPDAPSMQGQAHRFNAGSYDGMDPYNDLYQRGVPDAINLMKDQLQRDLTPEELQSAMSYYNEIPVGRPVPPAEGAPERKPNESDAAFGKRYSDWYQARQKVLEANQGLAPLIATYTVLDWLWRLLGRGSITDWSTRGYEP